MGMLLTLGKTQFITRHNVLKWKSTCFAYVQRVGEHIFCLLSISHIFLVSLSGNRWWSELVFLHCLRWKNFYVDVFSFLPSLYTSLIPALVSTWVLMSTRSERSNLSIPLRFSWKPNETVFLHRIKRVLAFIFFPNGCIILKDFPRFGNRWRKSELDCFWLGRLGSIIMSQWINQSFNHIQWTWSSVIMLVSEKRLDRSELLYALVYVQLLRLVLRGKITCTIFPKENS